MAAEKPYVVVPYKDSIFGPDGKFTKLIGDQTVADQIGREIDYLQKLTMAVSGLASLYRPAPQGCISTVLYPGIIPEDPLSDAIDLVYELESPHFLVAGHHLAYSGSDGGYKGRTRAYYSVDKIGNAIAAADLSGATQFFTQVHARHTGEQAKWVTDMVVEHNIEAIALMAAPGHLFPRAFCTQLKAFIKRGVKIPIIPVPHAISPFKELMMISCQDSSKDCLISQVDFHTSEFAKVLAYTDDVASLEEVRDYCLWLAEHEFFINN
ncbi:MAG: hypothetical protein R3B60_00070 [Candidatus Paceibacterota bacterium]